MRVMVRQFAQWLSGIDPRTEVPPKALIPGRYRRSRPYIYSEQEIVLTANGPITSPGMDHSCKSAKRMAPQLPGSCAPRRAGGLTQ
jgi:hypothetical protein